MPPVEKEKTINSGYSSIGEGSKAVGGYSSFVGGSSSYSKKIVTGNDSTVIGTSALHTSDTTTGVKYSAGITTGGYVETTNTNFTFPDSGGYTNYNYLSFMQSIKLSDNILLEERTGNVLVIPEKNIIIHWDSEHTIWVCSEINEFIHDLKENGKTENPYDSNKDFGYSKVDLLLSFFISSNGNYYLDLDNQNYYQYSSKTKKWHKLEGDISSLSFSRNYKVNSLKTRRSQRVLLCEKMTNLKLSFYGDTLLGNAGYVFAPYIPMQTTEAITIGDTTTVPNITLRTLSDRYNTTGINTDLYGTVTIGDVAP